ncbi:RNA-directed RNA polymerase [Salix suchowensis]|nr:RNA-directed RNA polymerase [Salix suchowensis]
MISRQGKVNVAWLDTVLALSSPLSKQTRQLFCLPHPLLQMGWLQSLLSPLKKMWFRLHSTPKKRRGIYILYEDVKSCQYEDVHVLWSILVESHTPSLPSKQ